MPVTKEQLGDWRRNVVTQELMREILTNMEDRVARLVKRVEGNVIHDSFDRAYIAAARDFLEFDPTVVNEEEVVEVNDAED